MTCSGSFVPCGVLLNHNVECEGRGPSCWPRIFMLAGELARGHKPLAVLWIIQRAGAKLLHALLMLLFANTIANVFLHLFFMRPRDLKDFLMNPKPAPFGLL